MRRDVVTVQAMAVAALALVLVVGPTEHAFGGLGLAAVMLGAPLLMLIGTHGTRVTCTIMPRTALTLWYGRPLPAFRDSRDCGRTAEAALWGARHTRLVAGSCVAFGCVWLMLLRAGIVDGAVLEYSGSGLLLPVLYAWMINGALWRPLERTARLVGDVGQPTRYSPHDAIFPSWVMVKDRLSIGLLMVQSMVKAMALFMVGSMILGAMLA